MSKSKDPSNELSTRMLSGWTLLAESCLHCNVPLVENRRQKKIECVGCGTFYVRDGDKMVPAPASTSKPEPAASPAPTPTPTPTPKPTPVPSSASKPAPSSASKSSYEDFDEYDEDEELVPLTELELAQMEERRKRNNKVSIIMGEKLLAGWTMLSDSCPNPECYQPLMRDTQKQMWCLGCNTRVVRQEDFDPSKHTLVDKNTPSTTPTPTPTSTSSTSTPAPTQPQQQTQKTTSAPLSNQISLNNTPAFTTPVAQQSADNNSNRLGINHNTVKLDYTAPVVPQASDFSNSTVFAISVLHTKIQYLATRLAQETHPEEIRVISVALKECALALTALGVRN